MAWAIYISLLPSLLTILPKVIYWSNYGLFMSGFLDIGAELALSPRDLSITTPQVIIVQEVG